MELITNQKIRTKILRKELRNYDSFTPLTIVKCIHCGKIFQAGEMQVYKHNGDYLVYCKHPECSGSIIDIIEYT